MTARGPKVRGVVDPAIVGGLFAFAFVLAAALIFLLTEPPRCPAGSYDGFRAVGCYRSIR